MPDLPIVRSRLIGRARELTTFYRSPLAIDPDAWRFAVDTQARAFLLMVQRSADLMERGGRIVAITYAPGGRLGGWQP